jgi:biopolymer transport protein TolR
MASDSPQRGALASQINVTPLVDVMLVLLIIFMVTAPIIQQGVEVNLPKVKAAALPGKEEQFIVSITRNRDVYLNDTRISTEQLSEKLKVISVERPNRQVFLRADDAVPYGEVVRTMAAIKAAGIEDVGMVTEMPAGSEGAPGVGSRSKRGSPGP